MTVKKIMSTSVVTVELDDSLKVVKEIFDDTSFHHVLVVEAGKLLGVISDRDLLKALSPNIGTIAETNKDALILNKKAHQIMTRKPVTLVPDSGIYDAVKIFNHNNISCIPVVDDENILVGLISWRDILKVIESNQGKHPNKTNQQGRS